MLCVSVCLSSFFSFGIVPCVSLVASVDPCQLVLVFIYLRRSPLRCFSGLMGGGVAVPFLRTLVVPGFFKLPHPDAYSGTQWVGLSELFKWSALRECFPHVIDLGELLDRCGRLYVDSVSAGMGLGGVCLLSFLLDRHNDPLPRMCRLGVAEGRRLGAHARRFLAPAEVAKRGVVGTKFRATFRAASFGDVCLGRVATTGHRDGLLGEAGYGREHKRLPSVAES